MNEYNAAKQALANSVGKDVAEYVFPNSKPQKTAQTGRLTEDSTGYEALSISKGRLRFNLGDTNYA